MDERVDKPAAGYEHAPQSRGPVVVVRRSRLRWLIGLIILLGGGLAVAWFWTTHQATQTASRGGGPTGAAELTRPAAATR